MKEAIVVPSKGSTGRFAASQVLDLIGEFGDRDQTIINKTDQEPAIKFLRSTMCARRGLEPRRFSKRRPLLPKVRMWFVERAVQTVEQHVRTLKSQLDERYGARMDTRHPISPWLCDYSMHVLNWMEVSKDGKTACERCKGETS